MPLAFINYIIIIQRDEIPNRLSASKQPLANGASLARFHLQIAFEAGSVEGCGAHEKDELHDGVRDMLVKVEMHPKYFVQILIVRWAGSDVALLANPANWI